MLPLSWREMKHILISMLFLLTFSWPALANEQFALECVYLFAQDLKDDSRSFAPGGTTYVFEENKNKLELISISGMDCEKIIKNQVTESNVSIECETMFSDGTKMINSISIHRFSGEYSEMATFEKDGQITEGVFHSGICEKKTKKF